jgi:hypothetical protein
MESAMNLKHLFAAASLTLAVFAADAQPAATPQPSPEQMKMMMQATMGAMVSVMGPMTDAVIEAQLAAAAKPETAERIAVFKKNLYDALLKKGFNGVDAMHIVVATPLPSAAPAGK